MADDRRERLARLQSAFGHWLLVIFLSMLVFATPAPAADPRATTVGMPSNLEGLVFPGPELEAKPIDEFKTPIASIRGAAELLRDGAAEDPSARARFLENILGDTERLAALVSRLLELSRIESAHMPMVPVDYRAHRPHLVGLSGYLPRVDDMSDMTSF